MAVSRMIFAGFFDRYPKLKLIVAHGGGALPFLAARLDRCWEIIPACREHITRPPSEYLKRIYADTALYSREALRDTIETFGGEHVMYGTDFPHTNADMAPSLARIGELPPALRDDIRGRNAQRVFGDLARAPPRRPCARERPRAPRGGRSTPASCRTAFPSAARRARPGRHRAAPRSPRPGTASPAG